MQPTSSFGTAAHEPAAARPATATRRRRVIDAPVRMFHALFALSFVGAYFTAESEHWRALHVTLGYTLAGLLAMRVLYGLAGPRQAGLGLLWRRLGGAPAWLRSLGAALAQGRPAGAPWRQGQNLLMALAVFSLLALALPLTLSGIAGDQEWAGGRLADALEEVHEFFGNTMLAVVLLHAGLVVALSLARRRNLAATMLSGRAEGSGPDLVTHNRAGLAALVLLAVLAFGAWQWQASPQGLLPAPAAAGEGRSDRHRGDRHQGERHRDDLRRGERRPGKDDD